MMKKNSHKNQIVITAIAAMIVVAGYLNFTGQEISTKGIVKNDAVTTGLFNDGNNKIDDRYDVDVSLKDTKEDIQKKDTTKKKGTENADNDTTKKRGTGDSKSDDSEKDSDYIVSDSGEVVASEKNPGEAVMVSNTLGTDYFASAKLSREQTRAKNKETLMNIVNNDAIASSDKKSAIRQVANLTKISEKESAAELMLEAKGFQDAMVSISDGNVDVVVNAEGLTDKEIAQIEDIVVRKTGIEAGKIVITPVNVRDNKSGK